MAEKTQAEIEKEKNILQQGIDNLSEAISENKSIKRELNEKKNRLIAARNSIREAKSNARDTRKKDKKCINKKYKWRGQRKTIFNGDGYEVKAYNDSYIDEIDNVEDALNIEIADIKVKIAYRTGLITTLAAKMDEQTVKLTNLVN